MSLLHSAVLFESITHIEDLPLAEFIKAIESLRDKTITEKLDGFNLWFGWDEHGFFTSREGKSPRQGRFYSADDYKMVANTNGFRAAHLALERVSATIKKILPQDEIVEIEVLFGRQPNTITYGAEDKNYIVILRPVNGTEQTVHALSSALDGKSVKVESTVVSSPDGEHLEMNDTVQKWDFTQVKPVDSKKIDTKAAMVFLDSLKKFAADKNKAFPELSNAQVAELSLSSVPKAERPAAKAERERVLALIMSDYKLPIKDCLLQDFVRKLKPYLQAGELHPSEDLGVEGVVVRDPETDDQIKIVDRDVFTAINTFNSSIRALVAGQVKTTDDAAPVELRGGAFGQAKIKIADLLGIRSLALSSGTRRILSKFKGDSIAATAHAFADSLNISDLDDAKAKIVEILKDSTTEISELLDTFYREAGDYKLKLKTGKEIDISPETMQKTLTAFAETKKDIKDIISSVNSSTTPTELVVALYGKILESLSDGDTMKECFALIKSITEDEGGDGGAISAAAVSGGDGTTGAASIAPVEKRLFGSKVIIKRARNFSKNKKFPIPLRQNEGVKSLLQSICEDDSVADDAKMDNATDVNDSAHAKTDVEFRKLRNAVALNKNVTSLDVHHYLNKAHDINNAVDTVAFGIETDTTDVVKVFVNAEQADKFEEALSQTLGQDDDIENVIDKLSDTFDIVDVEWPESLYKNPDEQPLNTTDTDQTETETEHSDEVSEDDIEDIELAVSDTDQDSSMSINNLKKLAGKFTTKESEMQSYGQKFKEKLLAESAKRARGAALSELAPNEPAAQPGMPGAEDDKQDDAAALADQQSEAFIKTFSSKGAKAIITLMLKMGVPLKSLKMNRGALNASVKDAAAMYTENASMRMWIKKLLTAFENAAVKEDANFEKKFSNKYQKVIIEILKKLGMPEAIERTAARQLTMGIKDTAKIAMTDSKVRMYLLALAKAVSADEAVSAMSEPEETKESKLTEAQLVEARSESICDHIVALVQLLAPEAKTGALDNMVTGMISASADALSAVSAASLKKLEDAVKAVQTDVSHVRAADATDQMNAGLAKMHHDK